MKNGAPAKEVIIPIGNSEGETTTREARSASTKKEAPKRTDKGKTSL